MPVASFFCFCFRGEGRGPRVQHAVFLFQRTNRLSVPKCDTLLPSRQRRDDEKQQTVLARHGFDTPWME